MTTIEKGGFEGAARVSGLEACQILVFAAVLASRDGCDLPCMDIMMPEMEGRRLCGGSSGWNGRDISRLRRA